MNTANVNVKNWKSLIKPGKLDVQISDDKSFAKMNIECLKSEFPELLDGIDDKFKEII